jgi:hypothetical protein
VNNANIIYGSVTKTKPKPPFQWFDKPNYRYSKHQRFNAKILDDLKDEQSILVFFKLIMSDEIINSTVEFTNLRISLIDSSKFLPS